MNFLSRFFEAKFPDDELVASATKAINSDPLIRDPDSLLVTSKKGIVTLAGIVAREQEKLRIEGVVRNAFTDASLKHERLINELKTPHH